MLARATVRAVSPFFLVGRPTKHAKTLTRGNFGAGRNAGSRYFGFSRHRRGSTGTAVSYIVGTFAPRTITPLLQGYARYNPPAP